MYKEHTKTRKCPAGGSYRVRVVDQHDIHWTAINGYDYKVLPFKLSRNIFKRIFIFGSSAMGIEYIAKNGMWIDPTTGQCTGQASFYKRKFLGSVLKGYHRNGNPLETT